MKANGYFNRYIEPRLFCVDFRLFQLKRPKDSEARSWGQVLGQFRDILGLHDWGQ